MTTTVENRALDIEIKDITKINYGSPYKDVNLEIITPYETLVPINVDSITDIRDYDGAIKGIIMVQVKMKLGKVDNSIYPYKDDLKIKLRISSVDYDDDGSTKNPDRYKIYHAILADAQDSSLLSNQKEAMSSTDKDLSSQVVLNFQLTLMSELDITYCDTGGIFRNEYLDKILRVLMAPDLINKDYNKDQLNNPTFNKIKGVNVVALSNNRREPIILIPEGTPVIELPAFLQEHYGLYSDGLGYFLQDGMWFVYPKYDPTQFSKQKRTLSIISLSPDEYPTLENTYRYSGGKLTVLSTGMSDMVDDSESFQLVSGNGLRYYRASQIRHGFMEVSNNHLKVKKEDNIKEFVFAQRKIGLNKLHYTQPALTDNPYMETSLLARGLGMTMTIPWHHGDIDLLYPGMPVEVIFTSGDKIKKQRGSLLAVTEKLTTQRTSVMDNKYASNITLTVFLNKDGK